MSSITNPSNDGDSVDLSGLVPKTRTINKKPLENDVVLDLGDFPNVQKSISDIEKQIAEIPTEPPVIPPVVIPKPIETILYNGKVLTSNTKLAVNLALYDELRVYSQLSVNSAGHTLYCGVNHFICSDLLTDKVPDYYMCVVSQLDYVSFGYYGGNLNLNNNSKYGSHAGIYKVVGIKNVSS